MTRLAELVSQLKSDNERIARERDSALAGEAAANAKVARLEDAELRRSNRLRLMPLGRACRQVGLDYEAGRRLCAKGLVEGATKTPDQIHWLVDVEELRIAGVHAGLLFDRLDGAG